MNIIEKIDSLINEVSLDHKDTSEFSRFILNFGTDGKKFHYGEGAAAAEADPYWDNLVKKKLLTKKKMKDDKGVYYSYTLTKQGAFVAKQMIEKGKMGYYGHQKISGMGKQKVTWKSQYGDIKSPKV